MKDRIYCHILLDASASMRPHRERTLSSLEEYIDTLKDIDARITLTQFNAMYDFNFGYKKHKFLKNLRKLVPVKGWTKVDPEEYVTDGMTPLYDAICDTIKAARKVKRVKGERFAFVIITDGKENRSERYDLNDANEAIQELNNAEDLVVFLGANQDSFVEGGKLGVRHETTMDFALTESGMGSTMKSVASNTVAYAASGVTMDAAFTDDQRTGAMDKKPKKSKGKK